MKHAIVLLQIAKNASCPAENDVSEDNLAPVHGVEVSVDKSEEASEGGAGGTASLGAETDSRSSLSSPRRSPVSASPRVSPATHLRVVGHGSKAELDRIVNMDRIPNYLVFENFMNTELFVFLKMNEYQILNSTIRSQLFEY